MDQRSTANILHKALARLQKYYALAQTRQQSGEAPPPPKVQAYSKSAGAGGVVQLLMMIIKKAEVEAQDLEAEEQHAQEAYAHMMVDMKGMVESNRDMQMEKTALLATTDSDKSEAQEGLTASGDALEKANDLLKAHHLDCDFYVKYFKVRQEARAEEMDAISDAKAILSGADFG